MEENVKEAVRLREEVVTANPADLQALKNLADVYLQLADVLRSLGRGEEASTYFSRAIEKRQRQISLLEKSELTAEDHDQKLWAYSWIGLSQGSDFNDWHAAAGTLQEALEVAETASTKFPNHQQTQTNIHSVHNYLARALDRTGNYRGALEHYEKALRANKNSAARFNLFTHSSQVNYMFRIAEMLQKMGQTEQALMKVRQALDLRREASAINHADPRDKHAYADSFSQAGKFFAKAGKIDEALSAYREVELTLETMMENGQDHPDVRFAFANSQMLIGDVYADCVVDGCKVSQTNRNRLREAYDRYKRAASIYDEQRAHLFGLNVENAKITQAKLGACADRLKSRSS
ncbi:MAG: tetratricopeptide repeat protein [Pyrinomonadaceae bacterium]